MKYVWAMESAVQKKNVQLGPYVKNANDERYKWQKVAELNIC